MDSACKMTKNVSIPSSSGHLFQRNERVGEGREAKVSIPSSSGHLFQRWTHGYDWELKLRVSIPSSSGHLFQPEERAADGCRSSKFQSLLLQVTSSNRRYASFACRLPPRFNPFFFRSPLPTGTLLASWRRIYKFQSLLLQVTSSNHQVPSVRHDVGEVSIPSSSGHLFQRCPCQRRENTSLVTPKFIMSFRRGPEPGTRAASSALHATKDPGIPGGSVEFIIPPPFRPFDRSTQTTMNIAPMPQSFRPTAQSR